ncbi:MAG: hypothetical protein ACRBF0_14905 [Calditrichia bacterium]
MVEEKRVIFFAILIVVSLMSIAKAQESEIFCNFSEHLTAADSILLMNGAPVYQDRTLRVAMFFVEFADADSNDLARGSIGWDAILPDPPPNKIEKKFRYHHYWEMFFTKGTYIDPNEVPGIHPDAGSHLIVTYGSMRDYFLEVSNNNLEVLPAVTHPSVVDSMFRSGIVNHVDSTDSSIIWAKLPDTFAEYTDGKNNSRIMTDAIALAENLYNSESLDVNVKNDTIIDRVFIYVAGSATGGRASG